MIYSSLSRGQGLVTVFGVNKSVCDLWLQLILWSETRYYAKGTIIADNREEASGLMVITAGQVGPIL